MNEFVKKERIDFGLFFYKLILVTDILLKIVFDVL